MRKEVKEVKHKGKVVGSVEVPIYESIEELTKSVDAAMVLDLFNKQNVIRLQGIERNKHTTPTAGKEARRMLAFNLIFSKDPKALTKFAGPDGAQRMKEYLESPEVQKIVDAHLAAQEKAPAA